MASADWGNQPGSRLGLDIGGTLAKLVFFESETRPSWCDGRIANMVKSLGDDGDYAWSSRDERLSFVDKKLKGKFHFVTFRSDHMEKFVSLMEDHELHQGVTEIVTTGGGAFKYAALFKERLGVELRPVDELGVVVEGISWLVDRPIKGEVNAHHNSGGVGASPTSDEEYGGCRRVVATSSSSSSEGSDSETPENAKKRSIHRGMSSQDLFPFLLVNIGSGVSVVKVNGPTSFERVSGSAIGGGTFWGLCKLLCPECGDFDEAGRLAEEGNASEVNLLVGDIYGGDYELPNGTKLPGSITASFFAKAASAERSQCRDASIVQALVKMVSSNICQIAYLSAKLHNLKRIVFTGNFLRQNSVAKQAISENMQRVSKAHPDSEPFRALFLEHEGYFGALGSFLFNVQDNGVERAPTWRRVVSRDALPTNAKAAGFRSISEDQQLEAARAKRGEQEQTSLRHVAAARCRNILQRASPAAGCLAKPLVQEPEVISRVTSRSSPSETETGSSSNTALDHPSRRPTGSSVGGSGSNNDEAEEAHAHAYAQVGQQPGEQGQQLPAHARGSLKNHRASTSRTGTTSTTATARSTTTTTAAKPLLSLGSLGGSLAKGKLHPASSKLSVATAGSTATGADIELDSSGASSSGSSESGTHTSQKEDPAWAAGPTVGEADRGELIVAI